MEQLIANPVSADHKTNESRIGDWVLRAVVDNQPHLLAGAPEADRNGDDDRVRFWLRWVFARRSVLVLLFAIEPVLQLGSVQRLGRTIPAALASLRRLLCTSVSSFSLTGFSEHRLEVGIEIQLSKAVRSRAARFAFRPWSGNDGLDLI